MMARKVSKPKIGRPKSAEPGKSIMSVKGTDAMEQWVDGLVDFAHQGTRALLVRNALRVYAESIGYEPPIPKR
jgi:hypothetical protein